MLARPKRRARWSVPVAIVAAAALITACGAPDPDPDPGAETAVTRAAAGGGKLLGNGSPCSSGAQCSSGQCVDGVCCDLACTGACDACNVAGAVGRCVSTPDGSTGNPACGAYLCDGASAACPTSCVASADCSTGYTCAASARCLRATGTTCATAQECATGHCVDGVCCDGACGGPCDACNLAGRAGGCTALADGASGTPSCAPYLCDGTSAACPASCASAADCAPTHTCAGAQCVPKKANGLACGAAADCTSGHCADGVCCDQACAGECDACNLSGRAGQCTPIAKGAIGYPSCSPYVCDGAHATCPSTCASSGDCVAGSICAAGSCSAPKANGAICFAAEECQSGHCVDGVCCDGACDGPCDTCKGFLSAGQCTYELMGARGNPSCAPYACSGASAACPTSCMWDLDCAAGAYCLAGACVARTANGVACAEARQCTSGNCVDGVCCETACSGACDACNLPGLAGLCAPSPAGAGGSPSCAPYVCGGGASSCPSSCATDAGCAAGYYCHAGACALTRALGAACTSGTQCASGRCIDGVCCDRACDDACEACNVPGRSGTCGPVPNATPASPSCSPYLCDGASGSCPASCVTDTDCVATSSCVGGVCQPVTGVANGGSCGSDAECVDGHCVRGVCCDGPCSGRCEACDLPGSAGTCTARPAGAIGAPSCAPFTCGGVGPACRLACAGDSECAPGYRCTKGICGLSFSLTRSSGETQLLDPKNPAAKSQFAVETATRLKVHVRVPISEVDVLFYDPSGREITYSNAAARGMMYRRWLYGDPSEEQRLTLAGTGDDSLGYHAVLRVDLPEAGEWALKTVALVPLAQAIPVLISIETNGAPALGVVTDKDVYAPGETVRVFAHLRNTATRPPSAIVGATLNGSLLAFTPSDGRAPDSVPAGALPIRFALRDDGQAPDSVANDGVYTGSASAAAASVYLLDVDAEGRDALGRTFQRRFGMKIAVR